MSSDLNPFNDFRRCVDYAVKIRVNPQQTGVDLNVKHSMVSLSLCQMCQMRALPHQQYYAESI